MEIGPSANAKNAPDRAAVVFGDIRFSWREWNGRINQLAHALTALGLQRSDKVAVLLHNCHQILEVGQAAAKTGLVTVPLNYRLRAHEIQYIVDNSDASTARPTW